MLAKKYRLSHFDFLLAKKNGKNYRANDFSLIIAGNAVQHSRYAVVTSSKLSKSAVVRNKLRRRIYSLMANRDLGSNDFLFFPRGNMLNLSREQIGISLDSFLSTLSLVS
jgi:ribonuclease P protein component